jgi:hypothetical protein
VWKRIQKNLKIKIKVLVKLILYLFDDIDNMNAELVSFFHVSKFLFIADTLTVACYCMPKINSIFI